MCMTVAELVPFAIVSLDRECGRWCALLLSPCFLRRKRIVELRGRVPDPLLSGQFGSLFRGRHCILSVWVTHFVCSLFGLECSCRVVKTSSACESRFWEIILNLRAGNLLARIFVRKICTGLGPCSETSLKYCQG